MANWLVFHNFDQLLLTEAGDWDKKEISLSLSG